jgi:hypothetical protein
VIGRRGLPAHMMALFERDNEIAREADRATFIDLTGCD